jgi:hypothetical protein
VIGNSFLSLPLLFRKILPTSRQFPTIYLLAATLSSDYMLFKILLQHIQGKNADIGDRPGIFDLIGHNPLLMVEMNHLHHAQCMLTMFRLQSFDLLARTIAWVYRACHSRGFVYDYFPIEQQGSCNSRTEAMIWQHSLGNIRDQNRIADIRVTSLDLLNRQVIWQVTRGPGPANRKSSFH